MYTNEHFSDLEETFKNIHHSMEEGQDAYSYAQGVPFEPVDEPSEEEEQEDPLFEGVQLPMDTELVREILIAFQNDFSPAKAVEIFKAMDGDDSGSIDHLELYHTIHKLTGFPVSKEQILNVMDQVDFDGDGGINFLEFLILLKSIVDFHRKNLEALFRGVQLPIDNENVRALLIAFRNDFTPAQAVEVFRAIDKDGSGSIDYLELDSVIERLLGFPVSREHLVNIMQSVDFDGDGGINFLEFLILLKGIVEHRRKVQAQEEAALFEGVELPIDNDDVRKILIIFKNDFTPAEAVEIFNAIDKDGSGQIDYLELESVIDRLLSFTVTQEQLINIMQSVDFDGDGGINFLEFLILLKRIVDFHRKNAQLQAEAALFEGVELPIDNEDVRKILIAFQNDFTPAKAVEIFKAIDRDNSGQIDYLELESVIDRLLGFSVTKEHLINIMQSVDFDGDGGINFLEFLILLKGVVEYHRRNAQTQQAQAEGN